ncbi:MAG: hypothetical protein LBV47_01215 [Bacteroidales bacterium]|jgi:hypothetical protein|nr:hypothetical protein [Bacteroidales bacterium]
MLFILLQTSAKSELNTLLTNYGIPIIAFVLIVSTAIGIAINYDNIIDAKGQGTRKEGITNVVWILAYVALGLIAITAVVAMVGSRLKMSV